MATVESESATQNGQARTNGIRRNARLPRAGPAYLLLGQLSSYTYKQPVQGLDNVLRRQIFGSWRDNNKNVENRCLTDCRLWLNVNGCEMYQLLSCAMIMSGRNVALQFYRVYMTNERPLPAAGS